MTRVFIIIGVIFLFISQPLKAFDRIVSIGSVGTELIDALELGDQIVAVDLTSTFPSYTQKLPNLGHKSQIGLEGILEQRPDLVVANEDYISDEIITQIKKLNINIFVYKQVYSIEGTKALIQSFGQFFKKEQDAKKIELKLTSELDLLINETSKSAKNVLFIYARGPRMLMVAGGNTSISKLINLAGATNVASEIENYKPLNTEALIKYDPEYIIMFSHGLQSFKSENDVWDIQGMSLVKAYKGKRIITIDANLATSFGLRLPKAIKALKSKFNEN